MASDHDSLNAETAADSPQDHDTSGATDKMEEKDQGDRSSSHEPGDAAAGPPAPADASRPVQHAEKTGAESNDSPYTSGRVPRSKRRGLWARIALIPEVEQPQVQYQRSTKWIMTVIVALTAAVSSTGSAIFYPALGMVADDLHTSKTAVNLSIALYLLAMAFTPLWWSSWSEVSGRRTVYLISFALFIIFAVISAVSVDLAMLVVFRVLTGGAAAAVQTVGAGTVSDLWAIKERGRAISIFYLGPLCGPGIAPIIGGALADTLGWRSTLWALVIFVGVLFLLIAFCLPETASKIAEDNDRPLKKLKKRIVDPLKTVFYLQHLPILITVYSGALAFAVLYVILIAIQADFSSAPYNYSPVIVGLLYIAPTLGYAVASQISGRWIDYLMARGARRAGRYDEAGQPIYLPEDRMQENIWFAATLYPLAMIWYGWTTQYGIIWIVPCIANFFFGVGSLLVFSCVTTMLTEFMPKRSASGVALNNLLRQIFATVAAIVVQPLIDAIGTGWMCTLVALFALVTGNLAMLALRLRGPKWRVEMERKMGNDAQAHTSST